jgi:hypothetical protein
MFYGIWLREGAQMIKTFGNYANSLGGGRAVERREKGDGDFTRSAASHEQQTPMSSWWPQLWLPHGRWPQLPM